MLLAARPGGGLRPFSSHAAAATGDLATRLRVSKESAFRRNGLTGDRTSNALTVYYQEVIAQPYIDSALRLPQLDQAIPLVLSGGTAMPKAFLAQFSSALKAQDFPCARPEVPLSADRLNSTVRGELIAAMC
jgi:hypothetical protein